MNQLKSLLFNAFKKTYKVLAKTPLRRVPGMLSVSNVIFRIFWPAGNIIEIAGGKMFINVNDPNPALRKTFQAYGMNLVHEEETTKLFRKMVKLGDVVLDLGANIGYFSILASKLVGPNGKIFAFEPEPKNFSYLSKNIEINNYKNVFAFQRAVADKNGKTTLYICDYDSGHHTINQYGGVEAYAKGRKTEKRPVDIEMVALDDFLKDKTDRVDVIKMDVEGAEALAINGMLKILKNNQNVRVFVEFFPLLMKQMGSSPEKYINTLLNDLGFFIYAIGHDYDLKNSTKDLIEIKSFAQLMGMLENESDHVNLYLTRKAV